MKNLLNAVVENNNLNPKQKAQALVELRNLLDKEYEFYEVLNYIKDSEDNYQDKISLNKKNQNLVNQAISKIKL